MGSEQHTPANAPPDLTNCDREPIHIPGCIQPHGGLLILGETDLRVRQHSANAPGLVGSPEFGLNGAEAAALFEPDGWTTVAAALLSTDPRAAGPFPLVSARGGRRFDAVAHRHAGLLFLELEPADDSTTTDADRLVRFVVTRLSGELRTLDFCRAVAREVRHLTGFDRVMVYRFDHEYNGEVIAEEAGEGLEPFLGLHYPASDIPAQARRLYTLNFVRHIPDVTYDAVPLVPPVLPGSGPTDMSFSVLRSVSPIHVEYLKNMGVAASFSISILRDGALWGLVACHHYSPRFLPARVRAACESVGVLMSLQLSARADSDEQRLRAESKERLSRLVVALASGTNPAASLAAGGDDLLGLTGSAGAAIVLGGRVTTVGDTPDRSDVVRLAGWLAASGHQPAARDRIDAEQPACPPGVLGVALGADGSDAVYWFRPEEVRTVHWAGQPDYKRTVVGPNGPRLSPRGSFALWSEEHRGRSVPWGPVDAEAALGLRDAVLAALARRSRELSEEARRKDEFLAVLGHELRGPLAPIRNALEVLRLRGGDDPDVRWGMGLIGRQADHLARLVDDLLDVSRVTQGKVRLRVERTDLRAAASRAVESCRPLLDAAGHDFSEDVPEGPLWLDGDPTRLTQVLTNLLTNAAKYTPPGGRVRLALSGDGEDVVARVSDTGVGIAAEALPRVFDLFAQVDGSLGRSQGGLGVGLSLVRGLVGLHGGSVRAASAGEGRGSTFEVRFPAADPAAGAEAPNTFDRIPSRRVLVVDDNTDAADSLALLLRLTGHETRTAADGREAVQAARDFRPDVALIDLGLPVQDGCAVARQIRAEAWGREIMLVAYTGWGQEADRARAGAAGFDRHLVKPIDPAELAEVLLGARSAG